MNDGLRYRALLLGNATYLDPALPDLKSPEHDVDALVNALLDPYCGLYRPENIEPLYDSSEPEATRQLETFFEEAAPNDVLLFFYSGHGELHRNDLYLCTRDTDRRQLGSTAVAASFISRLANETPTQRVVILLDCCNSGTFKSGMEFSALQGKGRFVLASTYGPGTSRDANEPFQSSPFTHHLASAMAGAAQDPDGRIGFLSVQRYVEAKVRAATGQQVSYFVERGAGDLILARVRSRTPSVLGRLAAQYDSQGSATNDRGKPIDWPSLPTSDQATRAVSSWAARTWLVPSNPVRRLLSIEEASTARLTVTVVFERREEHEQEQPLGEPPGHAEYTGSIGLARVPIDAPDYDWQTITWTGRRRGKGMRQECSVCHDGTGWVTCGDCEGSGGGDCPTTVPCDLCSNAATYQTEALTGPQPSPELTLLSSHHNLGSVALPSNVEPSLDLSSLNLSSNQGMLSGGLCLRCQGNRVLKCLRCGGRGWTPCGSCQGRGKITCRRCRGRGRTEIHRIGTVQRIVSVQSFHATTPGSPPMIVGPYRSVGSVDVFNLAGLPDPIRQNLYQQVGEGTKQQLTSNYRFKRISGTLDVLPVADVVFDDGFGAHRLQLVGDSLQVYITPKEFAQIRMNRVLALVKQLWRDGLKIFQHRPLFATTVAALLALIAGLLASLIAKS
jgi:hypothetical protein